MWAVGVNFFPQLSAYLAAPLYFVFIRIGPMAGLLFRYRQNL